MERAAGKARQVEKPVERVGSLASIPLAEVIKKIALEGKSGDLQVIFGRTIKTIYFDRGFIVFAASNLKSDRLGESLIEIGRISRHEFAVATMLMRSGKRKFGQALVQAGLLSEEELGRLVGVQVNKIILSLFKETDAIYSFDERDSIIPVDLMVSLSVYRILLEGIRRMSSGKLILAGLPPLATSTRVSERPPFTFDFDKLKPVEQAVLRAAGKGATLSAIAKKVQSDRGQVLRACYGLYSAGLLEESGPGAPPPPLKVQEETGVFVLSDLERKFAKIRATNIRQEILMEFDRLDRVAEAELLKVDRQADLGQLEKALAERRREWSDKRNQVESQRTLVMKVEEIQARIEAAYQKMVAARETDPAGRPATPSREAVAPGPAAAVKPASPESTQPEAPPSPPPLMEEASIELISPEVDLELVEEGSGPEPLSETGGASRVDQPAVEKESGPEEEAPISQARPLEQLTSAQRHEKVKRLLRDVSLHFQVRDYEGAIALLYELINLSPKNASYHGMLAKAMMKHPLMRKNAERHFIEALRLDPQNADLHYSLGLYYKAFGLKSRAEAELRAALRIDSRHEGARKHLLGEGKKDSMGEMFRKIFG